jgi:hypothetical protein
LQRVVDHIPIKRVIFLADRRSDRDYLHAEIRQAWSQMASDSPNSGSGRSVARLAVTDSYRQMQRQQGESTYVYYRLVARRWQSRRLAAALGPAPLSRDELYRPLQPAPGTAAAPLDPGPLSRAAVARPSQPGPSAAVRKVAWVTRLAVLVGCGLFSVSVALLTHYVNNNGGESLLKATNNDPASPLHPHDFWILIFLTALALVVTVVSMLSSERPLMIGTALVSLSLAGYSLHIPSEGTFFGFGAYGWSYWLSLAVAIAMTLSAALAAVVRSDIPAEMRER